MFFDELLDLFGVFLPVLHYYLQNVQEMLIKYEDRVLKI